MVAPQALPSAAYLHECFLYSPERGTLFWRRTRPPEHFDSIRRQRVWLTRQAGRNACVEMTGQGYKRTRIDGHYFLSHRIAFKMMTYDDPKAEIDHINADRGDNRWTNLRQATRAQVVWKSLSGAPKLDDWLPRGVRRNGNRFRANCGSKYLGTFETAAEARHAYLTYARAQRA